MGSNAPLGFCLLADQSQTFTIHPSPGYLADRGDWHSKFDGKSPHSYHTPTSCGNVSHQLLDPHAMSQATANPGIKSRGASLLLAVTAPPRGFRIAASDLVSRSLNSDVY